MLYSPKKAIQEGWIKRADGEEIPEYAIQPNAIDFTIDRVWIRNPFAQEIIKYPFIAFDKVEGTDVKTYKQFHDMTETEAREWSVENPIFAQKLRESLPSDVTHVNLWEVAPHAAADFISEYHVDVPEGVAALLIVRSTFNRGGLFVTSGLYDSGYSGPIGAALHNRGETEAYIGKNVRIGQIMFVASESVGKYAGGYNTKEGEVPIHINALINNNLAQ